MIESHVATMLWRLENQDARTRREVDERAGMVMYALRQAVGSARRRRSVARRDERRTRTAPATG